MTASPVELMQAMRDIQRTLGNLNDIEERMGFPPIEENNFSWAERQHELEARLGRVDLMIAEYGRPTHASLDALAAWLVACKVALAREDELRVETGQAA